MNHRPLASPKDPEHFLRGAQRQEANTTEAPAATVQAFVPRKLYDDYLRSLLSEAEVAARPDHEVRHDMIIASSDAGS
jgi:uncharacterized NAD(P)/FAD-binding protein YdhS